MKSFFNATVLFFLVFSQISFSQSNLWKFSTGDDVKWADPSFNDNDWKEIDITKTWETQGYTVYDGYGWYRKEMVIHSDIKTASEKNGGLKITLGKIDDADYTYFNGQLIGKTGEFPPAYVGKYDVLREYIIPASLVKWNEPNTIAVRVYDAGGGGGIYGNGSFISVAGMDNLVSIEPVLKNNHVFLNEPDVEIPVKLLSKSDEKIDGELKIIIKSDFGDIISENTLKVSVSANMDTLIKFRITDINPGFYKSAVFFTNNFFNKNVNFCFAKDPEKVIVKPDLPSDFKDYWDRAKKELTSVSPQFKMIKIDSLCNEFMNVYLVEMHSLDNALIRGWYGCPKKPGKYPAVLQVQGYSSVKSPETLIYDPEMISLSLNIRGHGNSKDDVNPGFPGFLLYNIHNKEKYIYKGAYMDCVRGIDFLFSRPEVDTNQVVVEGGSQGGALSFATAALDNKRIKLCVPHVPFLSDFREYFKVADWPGNEFAQYVTDNPEVGWESVYNTLSYIDIKNLATWIKCPVYMTIGMCDITCPPRINFAAYNNLTVPKEYFVYPYSGHGMPQEYYQNLTRLIKEKLKLYK